MNGMSECWTDSIDKERHINPPIDLGSEGF